MIRLYDAVMAVLYTRGSRGATFEEIVSELNKLRSKELLDFSLDDVWIVLVLSETMKVVKFAEGRYVLVMVPKREYKTLLEEISSLFEEG